MTFAASRFNKREAASVFFRAPCGVRKSEVEKIVKAMESEAKEGLEELLWNALIAFEDYPFRTAKGLRFHYSIKGNEIYFSRKEKSVTRATANIALEKTVELQRKGVVITGPKMLRCFGASLSLIHI